MKQALLMPSGDPRRLRAGPMHLRWPLPAVLAWTLAWLVFLAARRAGLGLPLAWSAAALLGLLPAAAAGTRWRQALVAAGFPLSTLALGVTVPAWAWALAAVVLLLAYPLRAWSDAPFFPTPRHALQPLAAALPLPAGARVLDAGCGLGHGLLALRHAWPLARVCGVEWSLPMAWVCRLRCRFAQVVRGDMWAQRWGDFDVVYLFQRPESMARAYAKARAELAPGAWLLSLEFEVPGVAPELRLDAGARGTLWAYRMPPAAHAGLNVGGEMPIGEEPRRDRVDCAGCKTSS